MTPDRDGPGQKKILTLFPELLGIGGIQEAGRLTAQAIDEIASEYGWTAEFLSLNDPAGLQILKTSGREVPFRGFARAKALFSLTALRSARKNVQVVLAAHPHLALPVAVIKWHRPGVKSIVMSHGVETWKPLGTLRRRALLKADLMLAPSRFTAQKLAEVQGVSQEQIRTLPWPLDPAFARMAATLAALPLPNGFPRGHIILTVGRWMASERYKGVDDLIRAVAQLGTSIPDLHLVAIGQGDDLIRLRKLAAELGVAGRVLFLEYLPREQIAACYSGTDVFALPSTGEGFGFVFLEAMAFGKPVVAASAGGAPDIVHDGVNGLLVEAGNSRHLAEALKRLLRDDQLRIAMGARAAAMVKNDFRFDTFKMRVEDVLSS